MQYTIDGDKLSMFVKGKEKIKVTYIISSKNEKEYLENNLKIGISLKLFGEKNDSIPPTIPNTFDYGAYLYHQHIYFSLNASRIEIEKDSSNFFESLKNTFDKRIKDLGNNAYLRAFVLGDKTDIENEEYQNIVENGVSHLFALSGMHLSFVYVFLSKLFSKVKGKKVIIYILLFLYLMITGFSVSFIRAILFMFLIDLNTHFKIGLSNLKILFLAASILLFHNPFYLYQAGFWYTFVVTFSLLFCHDLLKNKSKVGQIIFVSLITFLFSFPISIYLNYEVNLLSILNNIVFVPFISFLVFPCALLTFLFPFFLPVFQFFLFILNELSVISSHFAIPLIVGKITLLEVLIYYSLLLLFFYLHKKRLLVILFLFVCFLYHKDFFDFSYHVYFLDVGQGDASLFVAPQNKEIILIDTGGKISYSKKEYQIRNKEFDLADNIISFFKSIRIRSIDLLVITHGDIDHLGYATSIGNEIPFKKVLLNQDSVNTKEQEIIEKFTKVNQYTSHYFDYENLNTSLYDNENDNSLITRIKIYDTTFLLMGDASQKVEQELIKKYNLKATILKLGHHGSNTSSSLDFLKNVSPNIAIISSGRNNRYHHPSKETLENLNKLKIKSYNTQDKGTIHIKLDKKGMHIFLILT